MIQRYPSKRLLYHVIGERSHEKRARFRAFRSLRSAFGAGADWVSLDPFRADRFITLGDHPERSGGPHAVMAALADFVSSFLCRGRLSPRRSSTRFTFLGDRSGNSGDRRSSLVALRPHPNPAARSRAPWWQVVRRRAAVVGAGLGGIR